MTHKITLGTSSRYSLDVVSKATWDLAHDAANADLLSSGSSATVQATRVAANNWYCKRGLMKWAAIPAYNKDCLADAGLNVNDVEISLYSQFVPGNADGTTLQLVEGLFSDTPVVGDYDNMALATTVYATKTLASIGAGSFVWMADLPVSLWMTEIRGKTIVKLGLRLALDITDTPPTGSNIINFGPGVPGLRVFVPNISVQTLAATNIGTTTATIRGEVLNDQGFPYFNFKLRYKPLIGGVYTTDTQVYTKGGATQLSVDLTGLTPETTYTFGAFIDNLFLVTLTPAELQFTTLAEGGGGGLEVSKMLAMIQ